MLATGKSMIEMGAALRDPQCLLYGPVLLVQGDTDKTTPHERAKEFVAERCPIDSEWKQFVLVPGGYHEILCEENPEPLLDQIVQFCERIVQRSVTMSKQ